MAINGVVQTLSIIDKVFTCIDSFVFNKGQNEIFFQAMTLPIQLSKEEGKGPAQVSLSKSIKAGSNTITVSLKDKNGALISTETAVCAILIDNPLVNKMLKTGMLEAFIEEKCFVLTKNTLPTKL